MLFLMPDLVSKTLGQYLAQPHVQTKIDHSLNHKIIKKYQYDILYSLVNPPEIEDLDITLLVFLIRQLHPFLKPSNKIWTNPLPGDLKLEADITRLKDVRNKMFHPGQTSLTENEFIIEYQHLEVILCRLTRNVGVCKITPSEMKDRLVKKRDGPFESKPVQTDTATSVSDSLTRITGEDKTTSTTSLQTEEHSQQDNSSFSCQIDVNTGRKQCFVTKCCIFKACCCNTSEPETLSTSDHSSMQYRCSITGIAVLPCGTIVVTDTPHDNVQVLSSAGQLRHELQYNLPNSVCAICHDTVAVTLSKERKLLILNGFIMQRNIALKEEFVVKCECDIVGVKYNGGFLYVLCEKGEIHTIHSKTGLEQAVYQTHIMFPSYFDIAPDGNRVYISNGDTVTCMGLPSYTVWKYNDTGRHLCGIAISGSNKLYVSVWEGGLGITKNILKFSKDGKLLKEIVTENIQYPMALFNWKGHLYISRFKSDLDSYVCREIVIIKR